jgi:hypothetical protein
VLTDTSLLRWLKRFIHYLPHLLSFVFADVFQNHRILLVNPHVLGRSNGVFDAQFLDAVVVTFARTLAGGPSSYTA